MFASRMSVEEVRESLLAWRRGFELEHGRAPERSDEMSRPRIAALLRLLEPQVASSSSASSSSAALLPSSMENRAPPERKSSFSVLALRSQYLEKKSLLVAPPALPPVVPRSRVVPEQSREPEVEAQDMLIDDGEEEDAIVEEEARELDLAVDAALQESDDEDAELLESTAAAPVRAGFGRSRSVALMLAKQRNDDGKRPLFDQDAPVFAKPSAPVIEEQPRAPKRPNPEKPDKNYRRMNLSGQKKNFRRAGTGKWGAVNNSFVRTTVGGGSTADDDLPEQDGGESELPVSVQFDPGAALREAAVLREFAAKDERKDMDWSNEQPVASMESLLEQLGLSQFKEGQREVCSAVIGGDSVLALLPTGGGKSLCYVLPTLAFPNTLTLVVSPLLALMRDQMAALPPSLPGALLASDQTAAETAKQLARVARGEARVLFVAPERAVLPAFRAALARLPPVRLVCVDEAHCLSMWSHCFRTSYLLLRELLLESVRPRCVLALTATAVPKTCEQVCESLNLQHVVRASLLRPNLELQAVLDPPDAHASLKKLLSSSPIVDMWRSGSGRVIVYVSTQRETEQIAQLLTMEGVPASSYHAGQDPKLRRTTEDQFRSGKVQIVVATVAFGMGIDVSCVRCIVHFDLPKSVENYVQEVGRAGRDGAPASCVCFVSSVQLLRLTSLSYSHSVDARKLRDMLVAVRARGEGVGCIPTDSFVPRDVAATMLAWMHEEGLLRMLPEGYGSFQIRFFASGDQGSAVLAWALSLGTKKKKDAEWTVVDACKCAKDIGKTVAEVHEELEGFSKSKRIGYKLTDRSFFFELGERFSAFDDGDLMRQTVVMHTRLTQMEDIAARKCRDLYNILRQTEIPIKHLLQRYFETGCVPASVPDVASKCFVSALEDRFARGQVATLLSSISLSSGKEVARILHGIRGDDNEAVASPLWGKARHLEYRSLVELGNQMILKKAQE